MSRIEFWPYGKLCRKQAYCFPTLIEKSVFYLKWVGDHLDKVFGTFSKKVHEKKQILLSKEKFLFVLLP
jgi:hypothetical protein